MAKFKTFDRHQVEPSTTYQAPREATGVVSSRRLSHDGYSLWLCDSELADGGTIRWSEDHGDDAVYVFSGALEIDGKRCPAGGAVIVESGVAGVVTAIGPTRVAHYGTTDNTPPTTGMFGPPEEHDHGVHVYGPGGHFLSGKLEGVNATWFADSTCATCRCALLLVDNPDANRAPTHHHSEDEIIYLIEGGITMGAYEFHEGSALCIPGDARYAFTGLSGGHKFLNFRRDVSHQTNDRAQPPVLETAAARDGELVDDIR